MSSLVYKPQHLHRHRLHKVIHRITALLQSRRNELLSQTIETIAALSQGVENIKAIEAFLDDPFLGSLLQDFAGVADDEQSRRTAAFFFDGGCNVF